MASSASIERRPSHKRSTSSVLKSIINPRAHKRSPSEGTVLANRIFNDHYGVISSKPAGSTAVYSVDNHGEQLPLFDIDQNEARRQRSPLRADTDWSVHTEKAKPFNSASKDLTKKLKKTKSQTSLAAIFSRPKGPKNEKEEVEAKEKENMTPPSSSHGSGPPPIWAQFASRPLQPQSTLYSYAQPTLTKDLTGEIALYTPTQYSAGQQRNFNDTRRPSLSQRPSASRPRPYSIHVSSTSSSSSLRDVIASTRRSSGERIHSALASHDMIGATRRFSLERKHGASQVDISSSSMDERDRSHVTQQEKGAPAKRDSKVMAAVATFNRKSQEIRVSDSRTDEDTEEAFEQLLERRNVPDNMRSKMRTLDVKIKADFVKQDQAEAQKKSIISTEKRPIVVDAGEKGDRGPSSAKIGSPMKKTPLKEQASPLSPSKRSRPRSRTFSLHKSDRNGSPIKRQKSREANLQTDRESTEPTGPLTPFDYDKPSTNTCYSMSNLASSEDFVEYLRKVQAPKSVEVGKLHKLRLVLRNERVAWVDAFIRNGGMTEVVALLDRLMKVEWREEHEDNLLHETLLCLKALCTTAAALQVLVTVQSSLFPALLGMLFDKEKRGPSEFTTRGLIMNIILTYLASAPPEDLESRARTVLQYMRNPESSEDAQPLDFIISMQQHRPYRVWCKEITDVTKEVFWIFLHNVNVISVGSSEPAGNGFAQLHFPKERPPVPAAPHVGGVEWDATNYLTTHLDLMNALIASLPAREERNSLRQDLRVSGFEKIMGGSLRTCKEKFYGSVHDALRTWVAAAFADGWDFKEVRNGPPEPERSSSPSKRKVNKKDAPKLDLPKLDIGGGRDSGARNEAEWVLQ